MADVFLNYTDTATATQTVDIQVTGVSINELATGVDSIIVDLQAAVKVDFIDRGVGEDVFSLTSGATQPFTEETQTPGTPWSEE